MCYCTVADTAAWWPVTRPQPCSLQNKTVSTWLSLRNQKSKYLENGHSAVDSDFWAKRPNVKRMLGPGAGGCSVQCRLKLASRIRKHQASCSLAPGRTGEQDWARHQQPHHGRSIPGPATHANTSHPIGRPGPSGWWLDQWEALLQWPGAGGGWRPRCVWSTAQPGHGGSGGVTRDQWTPAPVTCSDMAP